MDDKQLRAPTEFAEVFRASFERVGCPRMAGRIWGRRWVGVLPEQTAAQTAERDVGLLKKQSPEHHRRLEEYRDLCVFFEKESPALIAKWERERRKAKP